MKNSTVLIISKEESDKQSITDNLKGFYNVVVLENIELLNKTIIEQKGDICSLIIDVDIISEEKNIIDFNGIPYVVITNMKQCDKEGELVRCGASEVIRKPFSKETLLNRLENVCNKQCGGIYNQLIFLEEYDRLTGLYNKEKFLRMTSQMLNEHKNDQFAFINFDIDRFQLINSFFGNEEGNKLLKYIAENFSKIASRFKYSTYGHMESDVFCLCVSYNKQTLINELDFFRNKLTEYNPNYDIVPSVGIYIIDDSKISIDKVYDRASLAAKKCKGSYVTYFSFYDKNMSDNMEKEQEIISNMNTALNEKQFCVYYQPKYDIRSNVLSGSEALVRWIHPDKGIVSPGDFIPVFEKNGFIVKLDYYVWEEVCKTLRRWTDEGKDVHPVSVNVSRVNLYNPRFVDIITNLVKKYDIPTNLLNLELTESAYTDNPVAMSISMSELQKRGFIILMDDFGSGYSSLSILKDIAVDIIKIDMRFFSKTNIDGRGENIIASVIRMSKWLHIPVIAEGVETKEQVEFLKGIGCEYVQGYYFGKPMPCSQFEQLLSEDTKEFSDLESENDQNNVDFLWSASPQMQMLFNNACQAVVICEYSDKHINVLRVNKAYYEMIGYEENIFEQDNIYTVIKKEYIEKVISTFDEVSNTQNTCSCEFKRIKKDNTELWLSMKAKYVNRVGNTSVLCISLIDITTHKKFERELKNYRSALFEYETHKNTMMIVDDIKTNRLVLREIFKNKFKIIEAQNGKEALEIIKNSASCVDIVLLDLMMPVMDGREFLQHKSMDNGISQIPVVIITADGDPDIQRKVISIGGNDYIIKPFIPEIVKIRVENVLKSSKTTYLVKNCTDSLEKR